jgi:hypothetical protein
MNRWNIPKELEEEVRARDTHCVYCGVSLEPTPGKASIASWEHIVNDATIITRENIARCCRPCNSSKGAKALNVWLESKSKYLELRGITRERVADVVKSHLESHP